MKNILMISYYYPPILDVGALRSIAFSKYLPSYGWKPSVLTVSNPYRSYCKVGDSRPPDGVCVSRAPSLFDPMALVHLVNALYARLRRALHLPASYGLYVGLTNALLPDLFAPWIPGALIAGMRAGKSKFDIVYVSCSPFSAAIVGALLKMRFGVPLVLDFRDPMTKRIHQKPENFSDLVRYRIERWLTKVCDRLVVVSGETGDRYVENYPWLKNKISVIHNGFDDLFLIPEERLPRKNTRFTILYSGNFYYDLIPPQYFFRALKHVIESGSIPKNRILFRYVGEPDYWINRQISESNLEEIFEPTGHVTRERLIEYLHDADVVLLRNYKPCITTKLYEALAMGKILLATIDPGEVEQMIKRYSPDSIIVSPSDERGIFLAIKELFARWESGEIRDHVADDYLAAQNWRALTQKLANILDQTQRV